MSKGVRTRDSISKSGALFVLFVLVSSKLAFHYYQSRLPSSLETETDVPIESLSMTLGQWHGQNVPNLVEREKNILKVDRSLRRIYTNDQGTSIFIYIGYWKKQTGEHQAAKHSPTICLPANGWKIHREEKSEITFKDRGKSHPLLTTRLLAEINNKSALFYFWFFSDEKTYADDWQALLGTSSGTFFTGRSDGGIVEISMDLPMSGQKDRNLHTSEEILEDFLNAFYPVFRRLLGNPQRNTAGASETNNHPPQPF